MKKLAQYCGDSKTHAIELTWEGSAFDHGNDWSHLFTAKRKASDPDSSALIQKTIGAGMTVASAVASVEIVPADTADLDSGDLVWDIQAMNLDTGEVRTVADGRLSLARDVTRLTQSSVPIHTTEPPVLLGPRGKSAYEVAVDNGYAGTEAEWVAMMQTAGDATADGSANPGKILRTDQNGDVKVSVMMAMQLSAGSMYFTGEEEFAESLLYYPNITTSRTWTLPDRDGTFAMIADIPTTSAGGTGNSDSGKVLAFGSDGSIRASVEAVVFGENHQHGAIQHNGISFEDTWQSFLNVQVPGDIHPGNHGQSLNLFWPCAGAGKYRIALCSSTNGQITAADVSGLGGAAQLNVGTAAGTVAAGNDSRLDLASAAVPSSQLSTSGGVNKVAKYDALGNLQTGTYDGDVVTGLLTGSGNIIIPERRGLSWMDRDGIRQGAGIAMWYEHGTNQPELLLESTWRIAMTMSGPVQFGRNDQLRDGACLWMSSGYSHSGDTMRASKAICFQTSTWTNGVNVRNYIDMQAVPLDDSGTNSVVRMWDQASVVGENKESVTTTTGNVTGNLIAEFSSSGLWTPGTAPVFAGITAVGATVTVVCDIHKNHQNHSVSLAGNLTLAIAGASSGMRGTIIVSQDVTGGRTLALPSNSAYQSAIALSTGSYATDRLNWMFDGNYFFFTIEKDWSLPFDAAATTFLTAAGITPSSSIGLAVNKLTLGLRAAGLWDLLYAVYPFAGGTALAHAKDLKGTYHGTFGGVTGHSEEGIAGSVANGAYFNSGFAPSAVSAKDSLSVYCYCKTPTPAADSNFFGAVDSNSSRVGARVQGGNLGLLGVNANNMGGTWGASSNFAKHLGVQRDDSANSNLYVNGLSTDIAVASTSACNINIYFLARNGQGTADGFSDAKIAFGTIGQALTAPQWAAFTALVDTFQTALGRKNT